jgi:hypothetical protein
LESLESHDTKVITSDTGLKIEQKSRIPSPKKNTKREVAPAAEELFVEPWKSVTPSNMFVKYISEGDREKIQVEYESDEEIPFVRNDLSVDTKSKLDETFVIYDESGAEMKYTY